MVIYMSKAHVRLSVNQTALYTRFPDRICIVEKVHDDHVPVTYDIKIPITNGSEEMYGRFLRARDIQPQDLRAVDELYL